MTFLLRFCEKIVTCIVHVAIAEWAAEAQTHRYQLHAVAILVAAAVARIAHHAMADHGEMAANLV